MTEEQAAVMEAQVAEVIAANRETFDIIRKLLARLKELADEPAVVEEEEQPEGLVFV